MTMMTMIALVFKILIIMMMMIMMMIMMTIAVMGKIITIKIIRITQKDDRNITMMIENVTQYLKCKSSVCSFVRLDDRHQYLSNCHLPLP